MRHIAISSILPIFDNIRNELLTLEETDSEIILKLKKKIKLEFDKICKKNYDKNYDKSCDNDSAICYYDYHLNLLLIKFEHILSEYIQIDKFHDMNFNDFQKKM